MPAVTLEKKSRSGSVIAFIGVLAVLAAVVLLENTLDPNANIIVFTTLKKGAVYALVAVSMNLLNGFTGLFSLGQAGFMLLGGYTYAILTIPSAQRDSVYYLYDGSDINFSFTESLQNLFGGSGVGGAVGLVLGVLIAIVVAGLVAAFVAWLIGLPVLKLKSDYLAIATLGFAEIIRAVFQWTELGRITNGANALKNFPTLSQLQHHQRRRADRAAPFHLCCLRHRRAVHLAHRAAHQLQLRPRVQGHPRGRGGGGGHGHQPCQAQAHELHHQLLLRRRRRRAARHVHEPGAGQDLHLHHDLRDTAHRRPGRHRLRLRQRHSPPSSTRRAASGGCASWTSPAVFKSAGDRWTFIIVLAAAAVALTALLVWRRRRSGAKKLSELWAAFVPGAIVLAYDIYYAIAGGMEVPFLRAGFRMVVFSVIIMVVVLFFRRGLFGDRELPYIVRRLAPVIRKSLNTAKRPRKRRPLRRRRRRTAMSES